MTDRRTLKRKYLEETQTRSGVYAIRNRVNGRLLVAGSRNAQAALNRHRFELKYGSHGNALLAGDWRQHGPEAFDFDLLDHVEIRDEPGFDIDHELEQLVALWRDEIGVGQEKDYERMGDRT